MHLNPYGAEPVRLAVSLANSYPTSADELRERCVDEGLVVDRPVTARDLAEVADFLSAWIAMVEQPIPEQRAAALNVLLARYASHPRLTDHAEGWHLHYRADDVTFAGMVGALLSVGTALHLTSRGMDRLGRCAADGCKALFADTSRNGRQRFCSPRCTNREGVRRFRAAH